MVLICTSLTKDAGHLLIFLLAICISSLEKCLFKIRLSDFFLFLSCRSFFYILDINPLSDI